MGEAVPEAKKLRQALGTFATGVTVVTTTDTDGTPRGFTANSFTSVSLAPPLILVCLAKEAATCPVFSASRHFCVNVLGENQQGVSVLFSSAEQNRFANIDWHSGVHGCPLIDDVVSWFECETHEVVDGGDHIILLGRIVDHDFNNKSPLVYCAGAYVEFGLLQRAVEIASSGVSARISAVIDCSGMIPMKRDRSTGHLSLPTADRVGNAHDATSLLGKLAKSSIGVAVPLVYAVYEDSRSKTHNVVYRGSAPDVEQAIAGEFEMIPLADMRWSELADDALRMLLERYIEESDRDAFGIYVGDAERGKVHAMPAGT